MSTTTVRLDDLDRAILKTLMEDARTPYAEMAKQFDVSPATIHVRIEKMRSDRISPLLITATRSALASASSM